jgi:urea ABC transporter ATP-binding protein UrtE
MFLEIDELDVSYGETRVINELSMGCSEDEILTLLGRNGMGKTTLMNCIMGLLPVSGGTIRFNGEEIMTLKPHERARRGITLVPQGKDIFPELTVAENLQMGCFCSGGKGGIAREDVFEYFPILEDRISQKGGTLSGGQQQMLAIARGLMTDPDLLLLDEPSEGVQPSIVKDLRTILPQIHRDNSIAIMIVEQNIELAFGVAERGYIIENGRISHEGSVAQLQEGNLVQEKIGV